MVQVGLLDLIEDRRQVVGVREGAKVVEGFLQIGLGAGGITKRNEMPAADAVLDQRTARGGVEQVLSNGSKIS